MRLICPNCNAQYNVADDAIPQGGRDVQCSSCEKTWFQTRKSRILSREVSRIVSTPAPPAAKSTSRDASAHDTPQGANSTKDGPEHEPVTDKPRHRQIDPSVANILRKEAARSHGVTDYSAGGTSKRRETSPEVVAETRKRIAQFTEVEGSAPASASQGGTSMSGSGAKPDPRSVPEINEINAALRGRAEAKDGSGLTELDKHNAARRQGFRRGFLIVLILMGAIVLPYVYAEQIVAQMPELSGYMATYVAVIEQLRVSLNAFTGGIIETVSNLIG